MLLVLGACKSGDASAVDEAHVASGPPYDVNHVLGTGQSNAIGFAGKEVLTTGGDFGGLMFDVGVMTAADCDADGCKTYEKPTGFVPLAEGDRYFDYRVETMSSGFANEASRLVGDGSGARHDVLVSVHGRSGNPYGCVRKDGCDYFDGRGYVFAFDDGMKQVADARAIARAAGKSYGVRAVTVVHGESDHYAGTFPLDGTDGKKGAIQTYADALVEWQRDYEAAIKKITGQKTAVPMFVSQMSNWNDVPNSEIPLRQLEAHDRAPGAVVMVGPTYFLPFADDCIHFTSHGNRRLGEYFAKAYAQVVGRNVPWEPLRPTKVTIEGNTVTARFAVPKPPLVLDTEHVRDPGNYGFEYADDSDAPPGITGVEVTGDDVVTITLERAPEATGKRLRYAFTATPKTCPGPQRGPRGNLRDSDATRSNYGYDLPNWAVHFDAPIE